DPVALQVHDAHTPDLQQTVWARMGARGCSVVHLHALAHLASLLSVREATLQHLSATRFEQLVVQAQLPEPAEHDGPQIGAAYQGMSAPLQQSSSSSSSSSHNQQLPSSSGAAATGSSSAAVLSPATAAASSQQTAVPSDASETSSQQEVPS